jgi:hypothetical protein
MYAATSSTLGSSHRLASNGAILDVPQYVNIPVEVLQDQAIAIAASHGLMAMSEVEEMRCECCGMEEECTRAYVAEVKASYCGRWICGICAEAVKEEHRKRMGEDGEDNSMEEAVENQVKLCKEFNNKPDQNSSYMGSPVAQITASFLSVLKRNKTPRSAPGSPTRRTKFNLISRIDRTQSCVSSFPKSDFNPL